MSEFDPTRSGIFVTAEQIAGAPVAVREWLHAIAFGDASAASDFVLARNGVLVADDGLAVCSGPEIDRLLLKLGENYVACQVVFQLGCDFFSPSTGQHRGRVLTVADFVHHTDVKDSFELERCLAEINAALSELRGERDATIYQSDGHGGIRVHPFTQRVIYDRWCRLVGLPGPDQPAEEEAASRSSAA